MIFHGVIRSGNLLVLEFLPGKEQSRISHFQALNTLRKLKLQGVCPGTLQGSSQHLTDSCCFGKFLGWLCVKMLIFSQSQ